MDFSISDEQREWQMKARKFAREEIRPISLSGDAVADPRGTFDWDIIRKGSKLASAPWPFPGVGRAGDRFRDAGAGHDRARPRRQRDFEDLQPVLEVEH